MALIKAQKINWISLLKFKRLWSLLLTITTALLLSKLSSDSIRNTWVLVNYSNPVTSNSTIVNLFQEPLMSYNSLYQALFSPLNVTNDKNEPLISNTSISLNGSENGISMDRNNEGSPFSVPVGFQSRVQFWTQVYSKYTSEDAIFHDSQNLSIVYKVVDLRPITQSDLHPFVKEHKIKRLIDKERKLLISQLQSLKKHLNRMTLSESDQALYQLLSQPTKKSQVAEALANLRMQLGQKDFVEKALINSDSYLQKMEEIFVAKGLPKELTRIPFVESSFNLAARSRVGASGIWQIMPATGRKLIPNDLVDYRNDPIKATEFAAGLLKFNYKVVNSWPLAVTAYNHGPTSIKKISQKYKTKDLAEIIRKAYGSHAFAFASSNFYACFLAILEIEKNRSVYFPETSKRTALTFSTIQLKKSISYQKLLTWFEHNSDKADQLNPHLASSIKKGKVKIPAGTVLYIPDVNSNITSQDIPLIAKRI